ncbi:Uncharacterised protein [Bordetella pertussis]|nr:Uncharacterised protein [Bordetella pertussis]CPM26974.1 Uncharacterised protein [Bordetella pertussis]
MWRRRAMILRQASAALSAFITSSSSISPLPILKPTMSPGFSIERQITVPRYLRPANRWTSLFDSLILAARPQSWATSSIVG